MKAVLRVTPDMLKVVFKNLYRESHAVIAARELVQNSMDACLRRGVTPRIWVTVEVFSDETKITCEDNGCGMTAQQLYDDFFELGRHSGEFTPTKGQTGGFGIAKMVVLTSKWWKIRSRDIHLDSDMYPLDVDITEGLSDINGTVIEVVVDDLGYWGYKSLFSVLALSDYSHYNADAKSLRLTIINPDGKTMFDSYVGSHTVSSMATHEKWAGLAIKPDFIPVNGVPADFDDIACMIMGDGLAVSIGGYVAYRINGLVQFVNRDGPQKNILAVDLITNARPGEDDYPLTNSRENVKMAVSLGIAEWVGNLRTDSLTTASNVKKSETGHKDKISCIGNALVKRYDDDQVMAKIAKNVRIELRDFDGDIYTDAPLARAWAMIVSSCTDEEFVPGLTGNNDSIASRYYGENSPVYYINPDALVSKTINGLIVEMWYLATHEITHITNGIHDEEFSTMQGHIACNSADDLSHIMADATLKRYIMNWIASKRNN